EPTCKTKCNNRSVFVRDTIQLSILPNYGLIEDAYKDQNPVYIKLQVSEIIADINKLKNVQWLHRYIGNHFSNIFSIEKQIYQDEKEMANLINLEKQVSNLQKILERESDSLSEDEIDDDENGYNSEDEIQELQELIQFLIFKGKLGSSFFISTELFLTYILNQKCSTLKIFYENEMPGIEFSNLVAVAGLAGSINHKDRKSQYFQNQEKFFNGIKAAAEEKVGFDCAWSKVRKASQASAKFIYNRTPEGK
ncbi:45218_t:CDS:2, partial [Gigaspora margarita]